jgi:hypothetical protein
MTGQKLLWFIALASTFFLSCEKEEGEGGTSTLTGRVYVFDYNAEFTAITAEYYAPGIDVFIIYGNDSIYADKFETGIGGWYRFEFLREGNYTVYAFSKDPNRTTPSGQLVVKKEANISGNHKTVILDDIILVD